MNSTIRTNTGAGSARSAVENMPPGVKMVFSGFEVGVRVLSGGVLTSCAPEANPCRQAYIDYSGEGVDRFSWDPLTLVAAVRNLDEIGFVVQIFEVNVNQNWIYFTVVRRQVRMERMKLMRMGEIFGVNRWMEDPIRLIYCYM